MAGPTLWLATDGGPCCAGARELTTSYTESCLHLMLRVLAFQMVAALGSAATFVHVAGTQRERARPPLACVRARVT